jgi:hypothetical protein
MQTIKKTSLVENEPLFDSAHNALIFAFNYSAQVYAAPAMNRALNVSHNNGTSKGLGGLDGCAQAGMILSRLKKLPELHELIIVARFAPQFKSCACGASCCSKRRINAQWFDAINQIADQTRETFENTRVTRFMRYVLIKRFFTKKRDQSDINKVADELGINRNLTSQHIGKINKTLKQIELLAFQSIENDLIEAKIVFYYAD